MPTELISYKVGEDILQSDGASNGFNREEGDDAKRRVGNPGIRSASRMRGGEAQREIFQRLVCRPLVV
ncbi:hypothetical protein Thiowin_03818 [Thiorhodovibrio winogradskyi]|uniref:Uncharacterized protein n=1 Tax=Thiorhodovibrio winogradskyi TaxID=77007 RepID=A0ABZ0SGH0_9GAMM|nr:hypothetical protein [Thiorhodovibrio winogradskyi]